MCEVKRFYSTKRAPFNVEAKSLKEELNLLFHLDIQEIKIWHRYDVQAELTQEQWSLVEKNIISEINADEVFTEIKDQEIWDSLFAVEYLPGQYDQRGDSAEQCIQIVTEGSKAKVHYAKCVGLKGNLSSSNIELLKNYMINKVDSREASLDIVTDLNMKYDQAEKIQRFENFGNWSEESLKDFYKDHGFAMSFEDLKHCQTYFKNRQSNPSETELKVIDTYWSDHCRHTTFNTEISSVEFELDKYTEAKKKAYDTYLRAKDQYSSNKPVTLMNLAIMGMKEMRAQGKLADLDESEEINACSIVVPIDIDGVEENYLIQFKNETHNHPTEIEPFGGAATCLGGAIRDPLSGRAYVYQAMRVTGSADPRENIEDTLKGKLPQRKITTGAADGYSSYGNQIGLATGEVREYYNFGFKAKRMEVGAVVGAVPQKQVKRERPKAGDIVIVLGGATGRDGCGGATGSSKEHDSESIHKSGAEVQKGNPPEERKLQRLFRNPDFTSKIKRSNDFGAGGVSVAVGELSDSMDIYLDTLPKKYEGLDGTELAISESQERMAVVIESNDLDSIIKMAKNENLQAIKVADITDTGKMRMQWQGDWIVDLDRDFLDTNGISQKTSAIIGKVVDSNYFENKVEKTSFENWYINHMTNINHASQIELTEKFDSSIGMNTVLMPYGGESQSSKVDGMVARIPVLSGHTDHCTFMSHGYDPELALWSPFHGGIYSGVLAVSKLVALGCDYKTIRLSCQEYFEKLRDDKYRWGKPLEALIGSYYFQNQMETPSIGGKDSMSGSFEDIDVPPTLITFALGHGKINNAISPEIKEIGSQIVYIPIERDSEEIPNFKAMKKAYDLIHQAIKNKQILSAQAIGSGGLAQVIANMSFGNNIGVELKQVDIEKLMAKDFGSIVLEMPREVDVEAEFSDIKYQLLGHSQIEPNIKIGNDEISISLLRDEWRKPLANIFKKHELNNDIAQDLTYKEKLNTIASIKNVKPKVLVPVFPGTNCEYDMAKKFEIAGGDSKILVFRNKTSEDLKESIEELAKEISKSQIIALPGGFSAGDEPDGSGKFIAAILRHPKLQYHIMKHLKEDDGLMIGICNGFQALIKLGLLPYGEIRELEETAPTLTFNKIGRHVSRVVTTKITSVNSPWLNNTNIGDMHKIAISHGEGRFYANDDWINKLKNNGQVITQYVDSKGNPSLSGNYNPNGSSEAIEGIISPDGRILGKMGHSERYEAGLFKNIHGNKNQDLFQAGINYFK